jgi:hypothetical protein
VLAISCPIDKRFLNVAQVYPAVEIWDETKLFEMLFEHVDQFLLGLGR